MSFVCQICNKKPVHGRSQQHRRGVAGRRWQKRAPATPRLFKPNLQRVSLKINSRVVSMRICAKCLKRIKKYKSIYDYSDISVA